MRSFSLVVLTILTVFSLAAQTPSAALLGHVTDDTGAPVAAARVEITSVDTNETLSFTTAADGSFSALQLSVAFQLDEKRSFQLRIESFNVPNHPNFDSPNVNVNAVNGGTITSANEGRLMQVALKSLF